MRTKVLAATAAVVLNLAGDARAAEPSRPPADLSSATFLTSPGDAWPLAWHDEFDGDALDTSKWSLNLPWGGTDGANRHHNEKYASYIMDHNTVVAGGSLKLLTRREDVTDRKGRTFKYTQGMVTTAKTFRQQYGYFEARVRLPTEAGPGLWPAFWTLADGWPPEMDICEVWTGANRSHQGLCYRPPGGGRERWDDANTTTPLPTGWTTYGMEWGPGYQVYNINGAVTVRVYGDHVTADRHYILLNSGVASDVKPSAATVFPNAFEVDYVRVYARPEVPVVHNGGFEHDALRPWGRSGQALVAAYGARTGRHALRLDGGTPASTSEQKVHGLKPNTAYVLSGWVKRLTDAGEPRLGVKGHGGDEAFATAPPGTEAYTEVRVAFTTGADATTATIYCFMPTDAGAALFDDVSVRAK